MTFKIKVLTMGIYNFLVWESLASGESWVSHCIFTPIFTSFCAWIHLNFNY